MIRLNEWTRWSVCGKSIQVCALSPERGESSAMLEGRTARNMIQGYKIDGTRPDSLTGTTDPDTGVKRSAFMCERVQEYVDFVVDRGGEYEFLRDLYVLDDGQSVIFMPELKGSLRDETVLRGRITSWAVSEGRLYVDLFNWRRVTTPLSFNMELIVYAHYLFTLRPDAHMVEMQIIQPLCDSDRFVSTVELDRDAIGRMFDQVISEVRAATAPDSKARTGAHCYGCSGAVNCLALHKTANVIAEHAGAQAFFAPEHDTFAGNIKYLKHCISMLKTQHDALRAEAMALTRMGHNIKDVAIEQRNVRRGWDDDVTPEDIEAATGMDPRVLASPKALEDRGVPKDAIRDLTKPTTTDTLKIY